MLISQRVTSTDSAHFPALDALYGRAFRGMNSVKPGLNSRRLIIRIMNSKPGSMMACLLFLSGGWRFIDYVYIEHLAVDDRLRSRGYGKQLLAEILQRAPLTILKSIR